MELAGILVSILIRAVIVSSAYAADNTNGNGSSNAADTAPVEFFFSFVGCGRSGALTGDSNVGVYIIASGGQSEPAADGTRVRLETTTAMTSTGSGLHRQATTARSEDSRQVIYDTVVHRERSSYLTFPADQFGCAAGTSRREANIGDVGKSYVGNAVIPAIACLMIDRPAKRDAEDLNSTLLAFPNSQRFSSRMLGIRIIADGPIDVWTVIGCQPTLTSRQCVSRHLRPINESTGLHHVVLTSPVVDDVTGTRLLIYRRIVVEASADDTVVLVNKWFSHKNHTTSAIDSESNSNASNTSAHSVTIGAFQTLVIELDEDESLTKGQEFEITSTKPVSVVLESTTTAYTDDDVIVTQLEPTDRWSTTRGPLFLPKQLINTTFKTFVRVIGGSNTSTVRIQYGEHQSDTHTEQFFRLCPADGEVAVGSAADLEGGTEHATNRSSVTVESLKNSCVYWYLDVNLSRDDDDDDNLVWVSADGPVSVLHLIVPHGQRSSSSKHAANRSVPLHFAWSITASPLTTNSTLQTDRSEQHYSVNKPEVKVSGDKEESDRDVVILSSSCEATGSSVIAAAVFDEVDRITLDGRDCNNFEYSEHPAGAAGNLSVTLLHIRCKVDVGLYSIVFQFARRKVAVVGRVFVGCCSCTDGESLRRAAIPTELISVLSLESEAGQSLKREAVETSPSFLAATAAAVLARSKRIKSPSPLRVIDVSTTTTTTELNATHDDVYRRLEITPATKMTAGYVTTLARELANNDVTTGNPSAAEKRQTASGTAASETVTGQFLNNSIPAAIDSVAVTDSFNGSDRQKVVTSSNLCGKDMPAGVLCKSAAARSYNYSDVSSSGLQVLKVLVPKDAMAAGSRNVADAMMSQHYHYNTDEGMHESDSGGSASSIIVILSSPTVIAVIASLAAAIFFVIACIVGFVIAELFCTKGGLQRVKVSPFVDDYD